MDSNPNEVPENICWEVDKLFAEIRNDLYVNHFGELVQGFNAVSYTHLTLPTILRV